MARSAAGEETVHERDTDDISCGPPNLHEIILRTTEAVATVNARRENLDVAESRLKAVEATVAEAKRDVLWAQDDCNELDHSLKSVLSGLREALANLESKEAVSEGIRITGGRADDEPVFPQISSPSPPAEKSNGKADHDGSLPFASASPLLEATSYVDHQSRAEINEVVNEAGRAHALNELTALRDRVSFLEAETETLQAELTEIYASTTWKLTGPLRTLMAWARLRHT